MKTNIDQLHKVVSGEVYGRRCGKTFARCHELAAQIELGEKDILCVITHLQDVRYLAPMIKDVFADHNLPFEMVKNNEAKCGDCNIRFIPRDQAINKIEGFRGGFVTMEHHE